MKKTGFEGLSILIIIVSICSCAQSQPSTQVIRDLYKIAIEKYKKSDFEGTIKDCSKIIEMDSFYSGAYYYRDRKSVV